MKLVVASLALCVALAIAGSALAAEASRALACDAYLIQKDCLAAPGCDWCGMNITNATTQDGTGPWAFCYNPANTPGQCCAAAMAGNPDPWTCMPSAQLCTGSDQCHRGSYPTSMGPCPEARCCPADRPQVCGAVCIAADAQCCGDGAGIFCNATLTCCGTGGDFDTCCPAKGTCCTAPDGEAAWCCPQGEQCEISPYFGCSKGAEPINMRKTRGVY